MNKGQYLNICILPIGEGPWMGYVEDEIDDEDVLETMLEQIDDGQEIPFDEAMVMLEEHFRDYCDQSNRSLLDEMKEDFFVRTNGHKGRYYMWQADSDMNICFVAD